MAELCLPLSYTQQVHVVGHSESGGLVRFDWSKPVSPTKTLIDESQRQSRIIIIAIIYRRDTQREYSSKPLKHSVVKRILVFKR